MRIGLVITELYPGGAEKCLVNLAIYLKEHGHEVAVWELWPAPPPEKRQITDRLDQHFIPWKSGGAVRPWQFLSATRWLRRELTSFQPQVVQSFLFHGNLAASLASRRQAWPVFGGARVKQPQRLRQFLQRFACRRMEKLVCVSHSVQTHCIEHEHIEPRKLTVIPNGAPAPPPDLDSQAVDVSLCGVHPHAPILLYVGRLDPQKGIAPLLEHADSLLEKLPEHHMVIIGDGSQRRALTQQLQACRRSSQIHLVGWQDNVLEWMVRSELLFLPAKYEGMPNVVLEAMSVAKPVVAFDVEGIRELLGNNETSASQIVDAEDFGSFIAAIDRLASDSALRMLCGQANLKRVQEDFDLETQLAKYEELYKTAANC